MDGNGETTIFFVKVWNPTETTMKKWLFSQVRISGFFLHHVSNNLAFWIHRIIYHAAQILGILVGTSRKKKTNSSLEKESSSNPIINFQGVG